MNSIAGHSKIRNHLLLSICVVGFPIFYNQTAVAQQVPCSASESRQFDFRIGDWGAFNFGAKDNREGSPPSCGSKARSTVCPSTAPYGSVTFRMALRFRPILTAFA